MNSAIHTLNNWDLVDKWNEESLPLVQFVFEKAQHQIHGVSDTWAQKPLAQQCWKSHKVHSPPLKKWLQRLAPWCLRILYVYSQSANHPYLHPEGWIAKGAAQQDQPNACKGTCGCCHKWSRSTAAKPDVFDLGKGQTTTTGNSVPYSLRLACGFPQLFATRVVRRDLQLIVLIREYFHQQTNSCLTLRSKKVIQFMN